MSLATYPSNRETLSSLGLCGPSSPKGNWMRNGFKIPLCPALEHPRCGSHPKCRLEGLPPCALAPLPPCALAPLPPHQPAAPSQSIEERPGGWREGPPVAMEGRGGPPKGLDLCLHGNGHQLGTVGARVSQVLPPFCFKMCCVCVCVCGGTLAMSGSPTFCDHSHSCGMTDFPLQT